MITIKSEEGRFVLYSENTPLAFCEYKENELLPVKVLQEPLTPQLRTALYKSVLSKFEKSGFEEALCKEKSQELSTLGFDDHGKLSLRDYFKPCCE